MVELAEVSQIAAGIQKQPGREPKSFHRPFLTVRNVQRGSLDLSVVERFEITQAELERLRLQQDDLLIVEGNGSLDHIGRNALFKADGQEWIHQNHIIRVRLDQKRAMPEYVSLFLNSAGGVEQMIAKARTSSGLYTLSSGKVAAIEIPLPPLAEQRRVVGLLKAQLAAVEKARRAAAERVEAASKLEDTLLRDAFGGIVPVAIEHDDVEKHEGWTWKLITSLARLESGHTPSRRHPEWWGGSVEWLQLSDVRKLDGGVAMVSGERTNELGLANSAARLLPAGTVCLSRTASVGFVTIMGREMATSQDFANWVCGERLEPRYLMYAFMASRHFFRGLSSGATHKTVYMPTIKSLVLHTPPLKVQKRIVAMLDKGINVSRGLVVTAQAELAAIEALPGRLLGEVFG